MPEHEFGQLLTEGIRHICAREGKHMQVVEDELGYAVKRRGSSAIRYWRQGHRPGDAAIVEALAREIVQRGRLGRTWLERFLHNANYADPGTLCNEIFPNHRTQHLPTPLTALIGREQDVSAVLARLKDNHVRLITLTGAPGVGKTRLALQVSAEARQLFSDGLTFVQLSSIREPALLTMAVANALGIVENDDQTLRARLSVFLQDRNLLLVLDNFEQVIDAAPHVAELLSSAPHVKVLVTSREPLHIYGEHEYGVPPLRLPAVEECAQLKALSSVPAVQLFVERATATNLTFQLSLENAEAIAAICIQLDGLPLAIELAASRSKWLTPQEILSQLNDRLTLLVDGPRDWPVRQQTLQAAIEWSYTLLNEPEQKLFRQLSVFHGGCTLEAVEMICAPSDSANHPAGTHLSLVQSLQDKNLLKTSLPPTTSDKPRYFMLETIREYAAHQLHFSGEALELQRRQRDWCLMLAEQAEQNLRGPDQLTWLNRLESEVPNLRAALTWCLYHPAEVEPGLRLAGALYWFWHLHSHFSEGCAWLDKLLTLPMGLEAPLSMRRAHAKALCVASRLHSFEADHAKAAELGKAGLAIFKEIGEVEGVVFALTTPAMTFGLTEQDRSQTVALAEELLPMCRDADDQFSVAELLDNTLGPAAFAQGDFARAIALHTEALALRRLIGDIDGIAWSYTRLARLAKIRGDEERAWECYEESRTLWQQVGNWRMYAGVLNDLGSLALDQDRYFQAQTLFEESLAVHEGFGDRFRAALAKCALADVARQQGEHELAQTYLRMLAATVRDLDRPLLSANYLSVAAQLAYLSGATQASVQLMSAAENVQNPLPRWQTTIHARHERLLDSARAALEPEVYEQAWQEGQTMSLTAAIDSALTAFAVPNCPSSITSSLPLPTPTTGRD